MHIIKKKKTVTFYLREKIRQFLMKNRHFGKTYILHNNAFDFHLPLFINIICTYSTSKLPHSPAQSFTGGNGFPGAKCKCKLGRQPRKFMSISAPRGVSGARLLAQGRDLLTEMAH